MKLVTPEEVLYKCKKVSSTYEFEKLSGKKLADDMIEFCIKEKGVGLAAPQIGYYYKFFIALDIKKRKWKLFINPEYVSKDGEMIDSEESCLTYGIDKMFKIRRYKRVFVRWQESIYGELINFTKTLYGLQSIIFQHETDHINSETIATKGKEIIAR